MQAVPRKSSLTGGITWFSLKHREEPERGRAGRRRKGEPSRGGRSGSGSASCLGSPRRPVAPRPGPEGRQSPRSGHGLAPWRRPGGGERGGHPHGAALPGTCGAALAPAAGLGGVGPSWVSWWWPIWGAGTVGPQGACSPRGLPRGPLTPSPRLRRLCSCCSAPYVRQGRAQPFPPRERCVQVATGQGTGTGTVHTAECPLRVRPGAQRLGAPGATLQDPTPTPGSWRPGRRCRREMAVAAGGLHAMRGPHARRGSAEEPTRQSGSHSGLGWSNRSHS